MTDGLGDPPTPARDASLPAQDVGALPDGRGRRIAVDVGSVRIGVASCDPDGLLATPVETVARTRDGSDLARLAEIVAEYEAIAVIVGLPTTLSGEQGPAARSVRGFARALARRVHPVPVGLHDERLTTAIASRRLRAGGTSAKAGRAVIDQAAAVEILQSWLDQRAAAARASAGDPHDTSDASTLDDDRTRA